MPEKTNTQEKEDQQDKNYHVTCVWDDWLDDLRKTSPELLENLEYD